MEANNAMNFSVLPLLPKILQYIFLEVLDEFFMAEWGRWKAKWRIQGTGALCCWHATVRCIGSNLYQWKPTGTIALIAVLCQGFHYQYRKACAVWSDRGGGGGGRGEEVKISWVPLVFMPSHLKRGNDVTLIEQGTRLDLLAIRHNTTASCVWWEDSERTVASIPTEMDIQGHIIYLSRIYTCGRIINEASNCYIHTAAYYLVCNCDECHRFACYCLSMRQRPDK